MPSSMGMYTKPLTLLHRQSAPLHAGLPIQQLHLATIVSVS
jgi:hypothetical protein